MDREEENPMKKLWESLTKEEKSIFAVGIWRAEVEGRDKVTFPDPDGGPLIKVSPEGQKLCEWIKESGKLEAILKLKRRTNLPFYKCVEEVG